MAEADSYPKTPEKDFSVVYRSVLASTHSCEARYH